MSEEGGRQERRRPAAAGRSHAGTHHIARTVLHALTALAAGVSLPLSFAPFQLYPLALVAPALLFLLWLNALPGQAAWYGYAFGVGMFGLGASWVHVSIHEFGHTSLTLSIVLTAVFVLGLAAFPAAAGYIARRAFAGARPLRLIVVFPAIWVLAEWIRGWFLTGFPWLNLGYSQVDSPLAGFAPLVGVYGLSWMVALGAGLCAAALACPGRVRWASLAALLAVFAVGHGLQRIAWTQAQGAPLAVSLVQGNVSQHLKWRPEQQAATLASYRALTRQNWDSDLVIWPETAVPAFYHQVADGFLAALAAEARSHSTDLIIGIPVLDRATQRYYNSLVAIGVNGGLYHKRHLVPFGEYVPLASLLRGLIGFFDLPMSDFSAGGDDQALLNAAGHRIGASICYEAAFGEEIADALPEAALLVNVSNDAWFGDSIAPHQHLQMARMRALETGRPLLRATNTGITAIIGSDGALRGTVPQFEKHVLRGRVQPMRGATPYVRAGNYPTVLLAVVFLAGAGLSGRRR